MRVTGIGVALIGMFLSGYCAVMYLVYTSSGTTAGDVARAHRMASNLYFPMFVSGVAVMMGVGLAVFGDKGFYYSRSLSERN